MGVRETFQQATLLTESAFSDRSEGADSDLTRAARSRRRVRAGLSGLRDATSAGLLPAMAEISCSAPPTETCGVVAIHLLSVGKTSIRPKVYIHIPAT